MNICIQTQGWISRTLAALGLIVVVSMAGVIILIIIGQSVPKILVALGFVATGGLIRVLTSPLTSRLIK